MRQDMIRINGFTIIDDCYNANFPIRCRPR